MQKLSHQTHSFDQFTLDLTRGCLLRGQEEIKLRPKAFDVLRYLIENQGRLVSKDELIKAVWPDSFVTDDSLVQCLMDVRRALGDEGQQIIKTVPRRGYIFDRPVSENGSAAQMTTYTEETAGVQVIIEETEESKQVRGREAKTRTGAEKITAPHNRLRVLNPLRRNSRVGFIVLAACAVIATAFAVWRLNTNQPRKSNAVGETPKSTAWRLQDVELNNLTRTGNIVNCAISPDGNYAVYAMHNEGLQSLWLRQIATDSAQQIAAPANLRYYGVNFSRDGSHVLFARAVDETDTVRALYRIPALGGVPEKLLTGLDWCPTFSPDGKQITFVRNSESQNQSVLMIADADGGGERKLAVRPLSELYTFPAWSPSGETIALSAGSTELGDASRDVVEVRVTDGVERTITAHKWYWIDGVTWLADGTGLIIAGNAKKSLANSQLWLLSYADGEARRITNDSNNYKYPILSADSSVLIAGRVELQTHLWLAPGGDSSRARRLTTGLGDYKDVLWTPDNKLLVTAFENDHADIWLKDPNGNVSKQLTANSGTNWGQRVANDGRYIVFDSDRTGDFHIWRIDMDGSNPLQLTKGSGEKFADISPDGHWVVYTSFRDWTLWKVSIDGGEPLQIAKSYARQQSISPDGEWIAYCTFDRDQSRLAIMLSSGGPPFKILDLPSNAPMPQSVRWSPDGRSVLFTANNGIASNIWQMPLDGSPPLQVTNFTADRIFSYDWSPDGKNLALVRGAWTSDVILLTQK